MIKNEVLMDFWPIMWTIEVSFKIIWINVNFDDVYEQCDVGNMMNVWFKGEIRKNRQFTDHVQVAHDQNVAHDQKIWIIEKFEQKIDFGEKYIFG